MNAYPVDGILHDKGAKVYGNPEISALVPRSRTGSLSDHDFSLRGYFAVELLRLARHCYGQLFFVAGYFQTGRNTPRAPAGARSAKGHDALGHDLSVSPHGDHLRIERHRGPTGIPCSSQPDPMA